MVVCYTPLLLSGLSSVMDPMLMVMVLVLDVLSVIISSLIFLIVLPIRPLKILLSFVHLLDPL